MNKIFIYCIVINIMSYVQSEVGQNSTFEDKNQTTSTSASKNPNTEFLASLRRKDRDVVFGQGHFCAGALITSYAVLAAAHCFVPDHRKPYRLDPQNIKVVLGSLLLSEKTYSTVEIDIKTYIVHEKYNTDRGNDTAIVVMAEDVSVEREINIAKIGEKMTQSMICDFIGWKYIKGSRIAVFSIESAIVGPMIERDLISKTESPPGNCSENHGGLLTHSGFVLGLVKTDCICNHDCIGVFVKVSAYVDWIRDQLKSIPRSGGYCFIGNRIYLLILFITVYKMSFKSSNI